MRALCLLLCLALAGCGTGAQPGAGPTLRASTTSSAPATPISPAPGEPAMPVTAGQVVAALRVAEQAILRPTTAAALRTAGRSQQLAFKAWSGHPRWDRRVLTGLPVRLRADARMLVTALRSLRSMHPRDPAKLGTTLPAWRIISPWSATRLEAAYLQGQRRYGVGWNYLAAINMVETAFGRIVGLSSAGAQGPMQFMPATWAAYGHGDVHDPHDAILGAAHYLAANGFRRSPAGALWHYNQSAAYVRAVTLLARTMRDRPRAFLGYREWQVYYLTGLGSVLLPQGYAERRPVAARPWMRAHHVIPLP